MSVPNLAQHETWNGASGTRWAESADARDHVLAPVADALLAAAEPQSGSVIVDIGCGCGATTLAAAQQVGLAGHVTGIDLSAPMLAIARERAVAAGVGNATFIEADAQAHQFEPGAAHLVMSRFGTMFFDAPEAAFANIASALAPGGQLCFATWQPLVANEWLIVPGAVLLAHADLPPEADPGAPGMFAQSDPHSIASVLVAAGFTEIITKSHHVTFDLGSTVDDAVAYLSDSGPGRMLLDAIIDDDVRAQAIVEVKAELGRHCDDAGVRLGGSIFITTASVGQDDRATSTAAPDLGPKVSGTHL